MEPIGLLNLVLSQTPRVLMGMIFMCFIFIFTWGTAGDVILQMERQSKLVFFSWVFLSIASSLLLSHGIFSLAPKVTSRRSLYKALGHLSIKQTEILCSYIEKNTPAQCFHINIDAEYLVDSGFLYRSTEVKNEDMGYHKAYYNIKPDVLLLIKKHCSELIKHGSKK